MADLNITTAADGNGKESLELMIGIHANAYKTEYKDEAAKRLAHIFRDGIQHPPIRTKRTH